MYKPVIPILEELISKDKEHENYNWDIKRIKSGPGVILYLTGTKK
jgi:hypothetical protein